MRRERAFQCESPCLATQSAALSPTHLNGQLTTVCIVQHAALERERRGARAPVTCAEGGRADGGGGGGEGQAERGRADEW